MSLSLAELRVIERIASSLDDINSSIKALNETIKKNNSNTNKNTMTYKVVESLDKIKDSIKDAATKSNT
jgi:hypothetical protein